MNIHVPDLVPDLLSDLLPEPVPLGRARRKSARVIRGEDAKRLTKLYDRASRDASGRIAAAMAQAQREVDDIFCAARIEAEAILAGLPDFSALQAAPAAKGRSALSAIRDVADRYGLAVAGVTRRSNGQDKRHTAIQAAAVRAVADACPGLTDAEIGALFSNLPARTVRRHREAVR